MGILRTAGYNKRTDENEISGRWKKKEGSKLRPAASAETGDAISTWETHCPHQTSRHTRQTSQGTCCGLPPVPLAGTGSVLPVLGSAVMEPGVGKKEKGQCPGMAKRTEGECVRTRLEDTGGVVGLPIRVDYGKHQGE